MAEFFGSFSKDLPAWVLALIAVVFLLEKMGLLQRAARRTDKAEAQASEVVGESANIAHIELKRTGDLVARLSKENDDLREANGEYRRENLMLVGKIERSDASRKRLLAMLDAVNKEQNDLIEAGQLGDKLLQGITQIHSEFENTRFK